MTYLLKRKETSRRKNFKGNLFIKYFHKKIFQKIHKSLGSSSLYRELRKKVSVFASAASWDAVSTLSNTEWER